MSETRNIINRLAEFFRYIRNELSGKERNSFERELQKDPFTDEALEGFSTISESEAIEDLMNLKKRIGKRTTRIRSTLIFRIAGIAAIIIAVSTVLVLTFVNKPVNQLAINAPASETLEIKKSEPIIESDSKENVLSENSKEEKKSSKAAENTEGYTRRADSIEADIPAKDNAVTESKAIQSEAETSRGLVVPAPMAAMARKKAEPAAPDSQAREKFIPSDSTLDEVVVIGYGVKKSDTGNEDLADHLSPRPVTGRPEFNEYIKKNLHRPSDSDRGKKAVVISFLVRTSGEIDSLRIIRSPGKEYSDEAIRVIKTGPAWKAAEENGKLIEEEVRLRIVFR